MKKVRKKPGEAARTFLRGIRNSARKIRSMEEHADFLRSVVFPGALRLKQVQVQESMPKDTISSKLAAVDAINRRIRTETRDAKDAREYAEEVIGFLPDKRHRRLLTLYYLESYRTYEEAGKTRKPITGYVSLRWHDVASEMGLRVRDVHRIHHEALIAFEEEAFLPEELFWEWVED